MTTEKPEAPTLAPAPITKEELAAKILEIARKVRSIKIQEETR